MVQQSTYMINAFEKYAKIWMEGWHANIQRMSGDCFGMYQNFEILQKLT